MIFSLQLDGDILNSVTLCMYEIGLLILADLLEHSLAFWNLSH